jgi:hypothetical protein
VPITREEIDAVFTYHAPSDEQKVRYEAIRKTARVLAYVIVDNTKTSADQSAAIRLLRECVMTANASIALENVKV